MVISTWQVAGSTSPRTLVTEIKTLKVINGRSYGMVSVKYNSKAVPICWESNSCFFYWSRGSMPCIQKGRTLPMTMSSELAPKQKLFQPSVVDSVAIVCKEDVVSFVWLFFFSDYTLQIKIWFTITCCCFK